jgi:hypothetical protein
MDRTETRLRLLAQGYTPLANETKRCFLDSWSSIEVDEALITRWGRGRKFMATGMRLMDGTIGAVDFDVQNKAAMDDIAELMLDRFPTFGDPGNPMLRRIGRPPKELWLFKPQVPFGKMLSKAWVPAGVDLSDRDAVAASKCQLELFGGLSGQIGAFGPHSYEADGVTPKHTYVWPDDSPLGVAADDVPVLPTDAGNEMCAIFDAYFRDMGWQQCMRYVQGVSDGAAVHSLTDDMVFQTPDDTRLTLTDLEGIAQHGGERFMISPVPWLRDGSESNSGVQVGCTEDGQLVLYDHMSNTSYMRAGERQAPEAGVTKLAAKMAEKKMLPVVPRDEHLIIRGGDGRETVPKLLQLYAFCPSASQPVIPIHRRAALPAMSLKAFTEAMTKHSFEVVTGETAKMVNPVKWWLASNQLHTLAGVRMRPDRERPIYKEGDAWFANSYEPPEHAPGEGSAAIGLEFMEQLAPDPAERRWLMQWLAYKFTYPWVRGPAVVMVAHDRFGTGRGQFGHLVRRLFGARYVQEVPYSTVAGKTYQAQYTDWMSNNLIVIVSESSESEPGATSYATKHNAYEHLKTLVEPGATEMTITRKRDQSTRENVFASFIIATNHMDALPIPVGDRRFAVITNGEQQEPAFWGALTKWMADDANITAFAEALLDVVLDEYSPYAPPPMFAGKLAMIDMSKSDLDRGLDAAMAITGDVVTLAQIVAAMRAARSEFGLEYPGEQDRWVAIAKKMAARKMHRIGDPYKVNYHITEGGTKVGVYAKTSSIAREWWTRAGLREMVLAGGSAVDDNAGSNVVNLNRALAALRSIDAPSETR